MLTLAAWVAAWVAAWAAAAWEGLVSLLLCLSLLCPYDEFIKLDV